VELQVENTGNSHISLNWSHTIAPDGWEIGFADPPVELSPRQNETVRVGVIPPTSESSGISSFNLGIYVDASNLWQSISAQTTLQINILETSSAELSYDTENPNLLSIERDGSSSQIVTITNIGNLPLTGEINVEVLDSDGSTASNWDAEIDTNSITDLAIGDSINVTVTASPNSKAENGLVIIRVSVVSGESTSSLDLDASVESRVIQGGLFGGAIPMWAAWSIVVVVLLVVSIVAIRIKRAAPTTFTGDELVTPDAHIVPDDGGRREAAMDSGLATDNIASGSVSADEIASALAQSIPALPAAVPDGRPPSTKAAVPMGRPPALAPEPAKQPSPQITYNITQNIHDSVVSDASMSAQSPPIPPPLPPTGLPPGWTNEQWQYYGHQWLAQQGQK